MNKKIGKIQARIQSPLRRYGLWQLAGLEDFKNRDQACGAAAPAKPIPWIRAWRLNILMLCWNLNMSVKMP